MVKGIRSRNSSPMPLFLRSLSSMEDAFLRIKNKKDDSGNPNWKNIF